MSLVVGAGCGGIAAALIATRMERSVVLTEPRRWGRTELLVSAA
jgi:pyruvate/2-oxoglutarate dehydrogenase complex dihydrolipoamide dehydrogenase (E3) component